MLNKRPLNQLKKAPVPLYPHSQEAFYRKQLLDLVDLIDESLNQLLIPALPRLQQELDSTLPKITNDSYISDLNAIIIGMDTSITKKQTNPQQLAQIVGTDTAQFNMVELQKTFRHVFGVNIFQQEPWLSARLGLFTQQNVDLIGNITDKALNDVKGIVTRGFASGANLTDMTKELQNRVTVVTKNRAKLIARDQVSKLNGQLTQARQTQNGISKYQWVTAGDERVRPTHAAHEGKIYSWNNPPADTGNPGEDINCRCVAIPIITA